MKKFLLSLFILFWGFIFVGTVFSNMLHAAEYELLLHHFYVKNDVPQKQMLEPWAKEVEELTNGRVKIKIIPRMGRGGSPKDLINQASEGKIADLVWTVNTYSGNPFPSSEVFELPFVHTNNTVATNLAMCEMLESDLKEEYDRKNLEVMFLHVHAGHAFMTKRKEVRKPEDLAGSRMRVPGRIHKWIAEELGAQTVNTTVRQIPQLVQRNAVQSVLITANIIKPLNLHQQIMSMTEGHDSTRFANAVLSVTMNKDKWNSMPPDIQRAFKKASDKEFLRRIGKVWEDYEKPGIKKLKDFNRKHIVLSKEETEAFKVKLEPVVERWIKEVEAEGIDGRRLVKKARSLIAKYSQ